MSAGLIRMILISKSALAVFGLIRRAVISKKLSRSQRFISTNEQLPSGVLVDIVEPADDGSFKVNTAQDFGLILKNHAKAILFAVPGAFTPTCSEKHLPGFIERSNDLKAKGVDAIYCLSVNDRFVMKSWAQNTQGFLGSGIKMVADGNCEYTTALNLVKDVTGSRMGLRSKRFAAILEHGKVVSISVDEAGLENSSAESMLKLLN